MDALAEFTAGVWLIDFEFSAPPGERPSPVCLVARELQSNRLLRFWKEELTDLREPPFPVGSDALVVAYYASAEMGCFQALGWEFPSRVLDLYVEFRRKVSGGHPPCGYGLLGALAAYGLDALATVEKESMRALAQRSGPFSAEEKVVLLDYCQSDVDALARLLPAMLPEIDLPRALLRGRYMGAVARMEWIGVPIDMEALMQLRTNWPRIQERLIEQIDGGRGIYEGRTFKADRFSAWLASEGIAWPHLYSGSLDLSDDTFREMARAYPDRVGPIRELRQSLSQMRLESLAVGSDGRNRCLLSPFAARTSRNQPSNAAFIFGPSAWLRGLIHPPVGRALAYVDFEQQEFGIAAALSGDRTMMNAYQSSDPYLAFAKQAGAVPPHGTKQTHKAERERFKVCSLAVQYGMGPEGLANKLGEPTCRGRDLIALHKATYPTYWRWSERVEMTAFLVGKLHSAFGWEVRTGPDANPRSMRNFPLQANGAEMLRLACIAATERGIKVCAPVHDALLIEADADQIEAVIAETESIMREASRLVLDGFEIRTDAKIVRWPDRYMDPRGERFWQIVWELIEELEPLPSVAEVPVPSVVGVPVPQVAPPSCLFVSSLSCF